MDTPNNLRLALERLLAQTDTRALSAIAKRQSDTYRHRQPREYLAPLIASESEAIAYAAWRMPATLAAVGRVFEELVRRQEIPAVQSHLDWGAGPGTAAWASHTAWSTLTHVRCIEQSQAFADVARGLVEGADLSASDPLRAAKWVIDRAQSHRAIPGTFDLVSLCYMIGELDPSSRHDVIARAWSATTHLLVIVEPGTHAGYKRLMDARAQLIELGGHVIAPCPHAQPCPLADGDWCHFSTRVARSRSHRIIKGAELGYEDEKVSYLAFGRQPAKSTNRLLATPRVAKSHVELDLCTAAGLESRRVPRRNKDQYKRAKKLRWGDPVDDPELPPTSG